LRFPTGTAAVAPSSRTAADVGPPTGRAGGRHARVALLLRSSVSQIDERAV